MVDAVVPVIEEIVGDQRPDPHPPVVGAQRKERKAIIDEDINSDAEREHEHAGNLAEDSAVSEPTASFSRLTLRPAMSSMQNSAAISATKTGMA